MSFLYDYKEEIQSGYNKRYTYNAEALPHVAQGLRLSGRQSRGPLGHVRQRLSRHQSRQLPERHELFSRTSDDQTILQLGGEEDNFIPLTQSSFNFIGRSIFFNQLTGDHRNLARHKVASLECRVSTGKRDEPDRRYVQQFIETQRIPEATRFFSDLKQVSVGGKTMCGFPCIGFDSTAYATVGFNAGTRRAIHGTEIRNVPIPGPRRVPHRRPRRLVRSGRPWNRSTIKEVINLRTATSPAASSLEDTRSSKLPWPTGQFLGLIRLEAFASRWKTSMLSRGTAVPLH